MPLFATEIRAIDPITGEMKTYGGPNVPAFTPGMAAHYCQQNGLGYCRILGELVAEIPCKPGTYEPDFKNTIDYEAPSLN